MKPIRFREQNGTLGGGPGELYGTTAPVRDLPVYRGGGEVVSCWQVSWLDRLRLLFTGRVWLRVLVGVTGRPTHSPVLLTAERPFQGAE